MLVQNIAALKLVDGSLVTDGLAKALGYYTANDAGGGDFYWDATSTETEDGGTVFVATGVSVGRWKRILSSVIYAKWFGVKGDKVQDDTLCMRKAIAYCTEKGLSLNIENLKISVKLQSEYPLIFAVDHNASILITCDLYGGETGMIFSDEYSVGGCSVFVYKSGITIDGVIFDGNLMNAPESGDWSAANWDGSAVVNTIGGVQVPITGFTALSIFPWADPDDDGAITIPPATSRLIANVNLINCVFQNTLGVAVRISGTEHKIINCSTNKSVGNFGDGFLVDAAYNIGFHNCKAYDFMRIGFCSDVSGAMQGNRNVYYYDCVAEYGHDCGREYGAGEANSGFWAENTADVGYYNCKAIDCGVNGFNYNQATPNAESFFTQTKSGVVFDNCVVDYVNRNSPVLGAAIIAHTDLTYKDGQQYMHAVISNCKIEHANIGIDIRCSNPSDSVIVENTYINSRRIDSTDLAEIEKYMPIVIYAGGTVEDARANVYIRNVKFKHFDGSDEDILAANAKGCFGGEIAVIRYGESELSPYYGDLKAVNLFVDNVYKDKYDIVTIKTWYSGRINDDVVIENSPNIQFGGACRTAKFENVDQFTLMPIVLNIDNLYINRSKWYNYNNDGLYDHPIWLINLYVTNSELSTAFFLIQNDCLFRQNKISHKVQFEYPGNATGAYHLYDISGNVFVTTDDWPLQVKPDVDNMFAMNLSNNLFLTATPVIVVGLGALTNKYFGSNNYYAGGDSPMQVAGTNYLAANLFKPMSNAYLLQELGTSSSRPATDIPFGFKYLDTTLSKEIIYWGGGVWKDEMGNVV